MSTLEPLELDNDEAALVEAWRLLRFLHIGLPYQQATDLALSNVDHHQLEQLIKQGCATHTAIEILT